MPSTRNKRVLQAGFLILVVLAIGMFFFTGLHRYLSQENVLAVREQLLRYGMLTPLIILFLYMSFNVVGLPTFFFSILSGYLYGVGYGGLMGWVGMMSGIAVSFLCSRYLFQKDFMRRFGGLGLVKKLDSYVQKYAMWSVLLFRTVSVFPYNVMNYAYGLTSIRFKDYFIGSAFGIIPSTMVTVWLGHLLATGQESSISTMQIAVFVAVLAAFILFAMIVKRRLRHVA